MRVLYINYEWDPHESTGAFTHIRELTRGLEALGHTVRIEARHRIRETGGAGVRAGPRIDGPSKSRLRKRLAPYLHESAAFWRACRGIGAETALIREAAPDVVLTRHSLHQFSSLLAARRCGVPLVFEVNAPLGYEYRRYRRQYFLVPGFAEWLELRMLARADGLFVVSEPLREHFVRRGIPADRIQVVHNGVDVSRFRPDAGPAPVRERFGEESVIIGFVGSFARFHGISQIRDAIGFLAPIRRNACFLLVGSGRLSDELQAYCRQNGLASRVHFTGHVPAEQVPGLMAAADILLAPYDAQEFFYLSPIKIFEYLASGRAVLAARLGQIGEIVQDGVNGLVYDPTTPGALNDRLLRLVDDPALRRRLGESARATAERSCTWQVSARGVSEVLERAVHRHRASAP